MDNVKVIADRSDIVTIADAVRSKTGTTKELTLEEIVSGIGNIKGDSNSSSSVSGVYITKITPESDLADLTISHNLGTRDILLAAAWVETLGDNNPAVNTTIAKFWARSNVPTYRAGNGISPAYNWLSGSTYASVIGPNTAAYETLTVIDENTIILPRATSGTVTYYLTNLTYTILVVGATD